MKIWLIAFLLVFLSFGCSPTRFNSDFDFGNQLAMEGLWKEALYRWQSSQNQGVASAALHNNMAIALEILGKSEEAEKEYELALKLDPKNTQILENFNHLKKNTGKEKHEK